MMFNSVEEVMIELINKDLLTRSPFSPREKNFLKNLTSKIKMEIILNRKPKISEKQLEYLCSVLIREKNFITENLDCEENELVKLLESKKTNIVEVYQSIIKPRTADIIGINLVGLYFPDQRYLINEIRGIKNSVYDDELNLWIVKVTEENFEVLKSFIFRNKFSVTERLEKSFKMFSKIRERSLKIKEVKDQKIFLTGFKLDKLISRILLKMEEE